MAKFTLTFEQPDELIEAFANDLGYQEKVHDPDFNGATESGEVPVIDNPKSREVYLGEEAVTLLSVWQMQFSERNALQASKEQVVKAVKENTELLKQSFKVTIE